MGAIYRRELLSYFATPFGWIFLGLFFLIAGIFFGIGIVVNRSSSFNAFLESILFVFLFAVPILTMRLIAEERRQKTDQMLLTSPVGLVAIVVGKYLAAISVFIIACLVVFSWSIVIALHGDLSVAAAAGGMAGFLLTGAVFIAVGTFVSAATENQAIAAIATFAGLLLFWLLDPLGSLLSKSFGRTEIATVFTWLSVLKRQESFALGLIRLDNVVFLLSVIVAFLFLSLRLVEKRRWS